MLARTCVPVSALLLVFIGSEAAQVTPVEKVIQLLKKLEAQVQEEGKKEAAQYDKFACFCKEQADGKLYAIERSAKKIKKLDAEVAELQAVLAELSTKIVGLSKTIDTTTQAIEDLDAQRTKARQAYEVEAADMDGAIKALRGAIEALKASQADVADADVGLVQLRQRRRSSGPAWVQVRGLSSKVLQTVRRLPQLRATPDQVKALSALLSEDEEQQPASYNYHEGSKNIIATLEGLMVQFKENKKELDEAEFNSRASFEKEKQSLGKEKKFAEKEKAETEKLSGIKEEQLSAAKEAIEEETKSKAADEAFMQELTGTCENKASEFDQRSTARSAELTAISEAMGALETGVAPNYAANKKLADLQTNEPNWAAIFPRGSGGAVSLLQVLDAGREDSTQTGAARRAVALLATAGRSLGSKRLAGLALRAGLRIDNFVKVRRLIKDMIANLKSAAEAEAETKSICDGEMKSTLASRDALKGEIEGHAAEMSRLEAELAKLAEDIKILTAEVAELKNALNEATELRSAEKADNLKTISEAEEGKAAVKYALTVLEEFYGKAGLLQTRYTPPNADREGNTVSDLAPETSEGEYKGKTDAASGILGLLEVIASDFERTISSTQDAEKESEAEHLEFEKKTTDSISGKEKEIKSKEALASEKAGNLANTKDNNLESKKQLELTLKELEKLKPMCVEGGESYEERKAAREQEIEALKQAMAILNEWKS